MHIVRDWRNLPSDLRGATVALGNFDGVHLGHVAVLRAAHSARPDAPLAVLTFEPHPREFFRPDDPPFRLTLSAERASLLFSHGVSILYELPFNHDFSLMPPDSFVTGILHQRIAALHLASGLDFAFGYRKTGNTAFLSSRAEALGMGLTLVPPVSDAEGPLSSSRIRRDLRDGYPERAAVELGRPWAIRGVVMHGDERGRTIGFPTANVPLGRHLEPARGVYAVTVRLPDGAVRGGAANIGRRPTVSAGVESRLEVNIFDFAGDLYGSEVMVALHAYIRPEQKFPGLEALKAQIAADVTQARQILDGTAPASP